MTERVIEYSLDDRNKLGDDVAICSIITTSKTCWLCKTCARYRKAKGKYATYFSVEPPQTGQMCEYYWPAKEEKDESHKE